MTIEQAQFILQSFRPDGSDSADGSFAEALALASSNRELGEWLARERAMDAAFAAALQESDIPESLRGDILGLLADTSAEVAVSEVDGDFIGALAQLAPPPELRSKILTAMETEAAQAPRNIISFPRLRPVEWLGATAAVAAVVFAAILAFGGPPKGPLDEAYVHRASIGYFNASFDPSELDYQADQTEDLLVYLDKNPGLKPKNIPAGLLGDDVEAIGCKFIELGGKKASLICFKTGDYGTVHLVTFRSEDIMGVNCPWKDAAGNCTSCPTGQFSIASWMDAEQASFLYSAAVTPNQLSNVF